MDAKTARSKEAWTLRSKEDTREFYDNWDDYEEVHQEEGYRGPEHTADFARPFLRPSDQILDVCGGTGLVTQALKLHGGPWDSVDVIDASRQMLEKARKKSLYRNYFCEFVQEAGSSIPSGTYDAVISCGGFTPGGLDHTHLLEIVRYVRSGGLVILAGRKKWLEGGLKDSVYNWDGEVLSGMMELENQGVWELVTKEEKDNYWTGHAGLYFVWRKK